MIRALCLPVLGAMLIPAVLVAADGLLLPHPEHVDLVTADCGAIPRAVPPARRRELLGGSYPDLV